MEDGREIELSEERPTRHVDQKKQKGLNQVGQGKGGPFGKLLEEKAPEQDFFAQSNQQHRPDPEV